GATGINHGRGCANIEMAGEHGAYSQPVISPGFAGIVLSLARQEHPDMSGYTDPEIVMRIGKPHHAGLIVSSPDERRVERLLDSYLDRFARDFHASAPQPAR